MQPVPPKSYIQRQVPEAMERHGNFVGLYTDVATCWTADKLRFCSLQQQEACLCCKASRAALGVPGLLLRICSHRGERTRVDLILGLRIGGTNTYSVSVLVNTLLLAVTPEHIYLRLNE